MTGPLPRMTPRPECDPAWLTDRLAEARAVIADVAHHSDHLIRLACDVLARHGETAEEREDAQRLLVVLDARRSPRARRGDDDREMQP